MPGMWTGHLRAITGSHPTCVPSGKRSRSSQVHSLVLLLLAVLVLLLLLLLLLLLPSHLGLINHQASRCFLRSVAFLLLRHLPHSSAVHCTNPSARGALKCAHIQPFLLVAGGRG